MFRFLSFRNLIAAALMGAVAGPCFATRFGDSPRLESYAGSADFIFRGIVEDVRYVLSSPAGPGNIQLPYTFVTFRVDSVMKGVPAGRKITLRFLGGLDQRTGSFMSSDQTPLFDVGDDDVLFATSKGGALSSLVRNRGGRFRVIDNQIYTDEGQEVTIGPDHAIQTGKRHAFQEVLTNQVGGRLMSFQGNGAAEANGEPSKAVSVEAFTQAIQQTVEQSGSALSAERAFAGDDPNAAVQGPDMTPAPPPGGR